MGIFQRRLSPSLAFAGLYTAVERNPALVAAVARLALSHEPYAAAQAGPPAGIASALRPLSLVPSPTPGAQRSRPSGAILKSSRGQKDK